MQETMINHQRHRSFVLFRRGPLVVVVLAVLSGLAHIVAAEEVIRVDCSQRAGTIRPLHGVNGGPLVAGETVDLSKRWLELNVPITRLHDCEWPFPDLVDMHAVFPRPEEDPNRAGSYRFGLTDRFVKAIVDTRAAIVYRLGESIEHCHEKQYVHPPANMDQWAASCLGIIRHYNEGWADGFHYGIRYWEIWNEPDIGPAMWTGSDDDYYRLYATAAKAIKSRFPDLRVGGPSVGNTGELDHDRLEATPFLQGFLRYCQEQQAPLDFFSWHTYTSDPYLYVRKAHAIRKWLNDRGFVQSELHLNEWNYLPANDWAPMLDKTDPQRRQVWFDTIGGAEGAAFTACVLAYLQDTPVDVANYYAGDTNPFGLFRRSGVPRKTYYAMLAFRRLLATPVRVPALGWEAGKTAACAGLSADRTRAAVLISNLRTANAAFLLHVDNLPWKHGTQWTVFRVDAEHDLEPVETGVIASGSARISLQLPAPGIVLVALEPGAHAPAPPRSATRPSRVP